MPLVAGLVSQPRVSRGSRDWIVSGERKAHRLTVTAFALEEATGEATAGVTQSP